MTALSLLAKGGIHELTMRNIADEIGVSEPAIYRHFSNKQEILLQVLRAFQAERKKEIEKISSLDGDSFARLHALWLGRLNDFSQNADLIPLIFSEEIFRSEKKIYSIIRAIMSQHENLVVMLIKSGQAASQIRQDISAETLAFIFLSTLRSFILHWYRESQKFSLTGEGEATYTAVQAMLRRPV